MIRLAWANDVAPAPVAGHSYILMSEWPRGEPRFWWPVLRIPRPDGNYLPPNTRFNYEFMDTQHLRSLDLQPDDYTGKKREAKRWAQIHANAWREVLQKEASMHNTVTFTVPGSVWYDTLDPLTSGMEAEIGLPEPSRRKVGTGVQYIYEGVKLGAAEETADYLIDRGADLLRQDSGDDESTRATYRRAIATGDRIRIAVAQVRRTGRL